MLFAQDDTLLLPFDATTLTDEQKNSNPDYLAYQVPELQSYQSTDCIEAVDLGLSVLWATCNVGASSPEDYGDYFAWGEAMIWLPCLPVWKLTAPQQPPKSAVWAK